jgi:hypothetical protein
MADTPTVDMQTALIVFLHTFKLGLPNPLLNGSPLA